MIRDLRFTITLVKWSSDALSRCENVKADVVEIPVEDDPYFQYVPDKVGQNFSDLIASKFVDVRQTFYNANSLSNLFTNVAGDTILQFVKEINLYTKT